MVNMKVSAHFSRLPGKHSYLIQVLMREREKNTEVDINMMIQPRRKKKTKKFNPPTEL